MEAMLTGFVRMTAPERSVLLSLRGLEERIIDGELHPKQLEEVFASYFGNERGVFPREGEVEKAAEKLSGKTYAVLGSLAELRKRVIAVQDEYADDPSDLGDFAEHLEGMEVRLDSGLDNPITIQMMLDEMAERDNLSIASNLNRLLNELYDLTEKAVGRYMDMFAAGTELEDALATTLAE